MKASKIISLILSAVLLMTIGTFAAPASNDIIALDKFESYGEELSGWTKPSTYGSVELVKTEKGTSVRTQKTSSDGWHEVQKTFSTTGAGVSSIAYSCSVKFDGTPSMYFYTKSNVMERWLVQLDAGKVIIGSETSDVVIESGKWYDFYIEYNMKTGYIRCTVNDGTGAKVFEGTPENAADNSGMWRISMALRAKTTLFFDDAQLVSLKYDVAPLVETISPNAGYIEPSVEEIKLAFESDINPESSVKASMNGDENFFSEAVIDGSTLTLKLPSALDWGERYVFEYSGVTLMDESEKSGRYIYFTNALCTVKDFAFSKEVLESGEISASAFVSSANGNIDKALMLFVLYDSETGQIAAENFESISVGKEDGEISTGITVPDDGKKYKAVVYLWDDMFNMLALTECIELLAN